MRFITAIGTYLPCGDCDVRRIVSADADAVTLAAAGTGEAAELGRGRVVLPRVAMRSAVPDYGNAVQPESEAA